MPEWSVINWDTKKQVRIYRVYTTQWIFHHLSITCVITDALAVSTAYYGRGSGSVLISRVECKGDEKSILECEYDLHTPPCSHSEDAGVRCTGMLYIHELLHTHTQHQCKSRYCLKSIYSVI